MDKTKIIPIIFLIVVLGVGFIAFSFYSEKQNAVRENEKIKEEKAVLIEENNNLRYRYNKIEKEKESVGKKLSMIEKELSRTERDIDNWKRKWTDVSRERDVLVEKLRKPLQQTELAVMPAQIEQEPKTSEEHWAKFVKEKAMLEVKLDNLSKEFLEAKARITELDKNNRELSIKIDGLNKVKERLAQDMKFKERTLRIVSMDLVSEREERGMAVVELNKLRRENVSLKRELILANKEKLKVQSNLKEALGKKEILEDKIIEAESIMKDKFLTLEELQRELEETVFEGKKAIISDSVSVELPPIIVKPQTSGIKGLQGEVIAINLEEKFVVVNIGEASGLMPGVTLKVMRGTKEIASIEVLETRKEISAADIKSVTPGTSIQEGDLVVSR